MKMPKVSVIIPIYNVEQWIERCAHSLFSQTLEDIELIFVDDGSTDASIEILQEVRSCYQNWGGSMRLIYNKRNQGVAYTRTVGMKAATGEYMIHCDPDDWVEPNMYEEMYKTAKENDADIVMCNYIEEYRGNKFERRNSLYSNNTHECLAFYYEKTFFPSLGSALIERNVILNNKIFPFEGINTGEDLNVIFRSFFHSNKVKHIDSAYYHYIRRDGSLSLQSDTFSLFKNNIYPNITQINDFFERQADRDTFIATMNYLKFQKKMFLLQGKKPQLREWWNTWPESNKDILRFTSLPNRTRKIFNICSKSYLFLWTYFKVVRKIIK